MGINYDKKIWGEKMQLSYNYIIKKVNLKLIYEVLLGIA